MCLNLKNNSKNEYLLPSAQLKKKKITSTLSLIECPSLPAREQTPESFLSS